MQSPSHTHFRASHFFSLCITVGKGSYLRTNSSSVAWQKSGRFLNKSVLLNLGKSWLKLKVDSYVYPGTCLGTPGFGYATCYVQAIN